MSEYSVHLSSYHMVNNSHVVYLVRIETSSGTFHVKDRFSGFEELYQLVRKKVSTFVGLPTLPPKKLFGNMKPEFLE